MQNWEHLKLNKAIDFKRFVKKMSDLANFANFKKFQHSFIKVLTDFDQKSCNIGNYCQKKWLILQILQVFKNFPKFQNNLRKICGDISLCQLHNHYFIAFQQIPSTCPQD